MHRASLDRLRSSHGSQARYHVQVRAYSACYQCLSAVNVPVELLFTTLHQFEMQLLDNNEPLLRAAV